MRSLRYAALALVLFAASSVGAGPPDVRTIVQGMKAALETDHPSTSTVVMVIRSQGETVEWTGRQVRKKLGNGKRMLTVLLKPADVKGIALLIWERRQERADKQWIYLPYLRRVREMLPVGAFESFLGTDCTVADLGFVDLRHRTFSLLGEEKLGNVQTYKVQEVLKDPRYYSRIVTWVATDGMLPVRRDYYDMGNALWKTELYDDVKTINGVPSPLRIRMEDKQTGNSTELRVRNLHYDVHLPDELFDPLRLPQTVKELF